MKLQILIGLLLTSIASAQHPLDFVPDDAIAVLSIKNGEALNTTLNTIAEKSRGSSTSSALQMYLSQFIENPDEVDLSAEILVLVVPTVLAEGQKPAGMFGPTPHMVLVCKAKKDSVLELAKSSGLKTTTTVGGWFVASGADNWSPPANGAPSLLLSKMPHSQISLIVDFSLVWKQFGPIAQMMGGMAIGSMNRPGADGVINPDTRKATASASKGFKAFTKWCATVDDITIGADFSDIMVVDINVNLKEGKNPTIDNSAMVEMSKLLSDTMFQHAMSGKLARKFVDMDLQSMQGLANFGEGVPAFMTQGFIELSDLLSVSVGSYALNGQNGLTVAVLSETKDQDKYLRLIPNYVNELTGILLNEFSIGIDETNSSHTWEVNVIDSVFENQDVLKAVIRKDDQLRFGKQGSSRIAMAFGPSNWRPFTEPRSTPLNQVIQGHAKNVDIDFAMSFDFRSLLVGYSEITKLAATDDEFSIPSAPSAKNSILFGTTETGTYVEIKSDLYGMATLFGQMDAIRKTSKK